MFCMMYVYRMLLSYPVSYMYVLLTFVYDVSCAVNTLSFGVCRFSVVFESLLSVWWKDGSKDDEWIDWWKDRRKDIRMIEEWVREWGSDENVIKGQQPG